MIKIEYLLPFITKDGICRDIRSFNSLLGSHSDISISDKKLRYKGSDYSYVVSVNEVPSQECTVFHVILEISQVTEKFQEMLRSFNKTVGVHLKDDIQILWNDIGFERSKNLYPRIYQTENMMRKLISKFMLINLGAGWYKSAIPNEVKDSIKSPKAKGKNGVLYEVDFIQLSNFLFKQYSIKDINKLPEVIEKFLEEEVLKEKKEEILEYIPKNNWDRYFSQIVKCESDQLNKKWTRLYEIRCIVAHNNSLSLDEYNEGRELCDFLDTILQSAFDDLDKVEVSKEEIESITLNTIATVHEPTRAFVNDYYNFNTGLTGIINQNKSIFTHINDFVNPINAILDSSINGYLTISDPLKNSLSAIETAKSTLIASESFERINSITDNYNKLFSDASLGIVNGFVNLKTNSEFSKYLNYENNFITIKKKE